MHYKAGHDDPHLGSTRTWEVETAGSGIQGYFQLYSKVLKLRQTLLQKK